MYLQERYRSVMEAANISITDLDAPAGSGGLGRRNSTGMGRRSSIGLALDGSTGVAVATELAVVADAAAAAAQEDKVGGHRCRVLHLGV
jgi:hypothetical protein